MTYDPERLASAVAAVMEAKGLNPNAWAVKASALPGSGSISHNTINNILSGYTRAPRIDTLYALAEAAGVPLWQILGEHVPWKAEAEELRRRLNALKAHEHERRQLLDQALRDTDLPSND